MQCWYINCNVVKLTARVYKLSIKIFLDKVPLYKMFTSTTRHALQVTHRYVQDCTKLRIRCNKSYYLDYFLSNCYITFPKLHVCPKQDCKHSFGLF